MTETLKNFLKKISEDNALAEKFNKLETDEFIAAAKELGFDLTAADFAPSEGELSEDELNMVSGGISFGPNCSCTSAGMGVLPQ